MKTPQEMLDDAWTVKVPEYHYALEWDIVDNRSPVVIATHQRREFDNRAAFEEYRGHIRDAENAGMCENVKVFIRKIHAYPWVEDIDHSPKKVN